MGAGARIAALLVLAAPCFADEPVEVVSSHVESVSVTIYRDLFALVTETRTVDLPPGAVTLSFEGVVETLIPESAVLANLDRTLEERNYDYDQLTPHSLIGKSVGKSVTVTRTLPGSGKVKQDRAVITSASAEGIVLRTDEGNEALHCSGLPEHMTFDEIPGDLHPKPKLSVRLAAGTGGARTVRLSYLAHGFAWSSDYVARLDAMGKRMDLRGWVTLRNFTNANLRGANVQVVAGRLHLLDAGERGSSSVGDTDDYSGPGQLRRAREGRLEDLKQELEAEPDLAPRIYSVCHTVALPTFDRGEGLQRFGGDYAQEMGSIDEIMVTGARLSASAEREELGDYQLYRLPWATDLNARQTKQAVFLDKRGVKIERFYGFRLDVEDFRSDESAVQPESILSFENRKSSGLGEPLPEGMFRLFESTPTGDLFAGEAQIDDHAVGTPVEATVAHAIDLQFDVVVDRDTEEDRDGEEVAEIADVMVSVRSAKQVPVTVELRQSLDAGMPNATIVNSNRRVGRKFGDFAWRFRVAANSADTLTYRLRVPYPDEEDEEENEEEQD
jgi:hypothetical protein